MVDKLTTKELRHYKRCRVSLDKLHVTKQVNKVNIWGYNLNSTELHRYQKGRTFKLDRKNRYNELVIDGRVCRVYLSASRNLRVPASASPNHSHAKRMLNGSIDKSDIQKRQSDGAASHPKSVSLNNTLYISPIATRNYEPASTPVKNYESMYKEYLQKVQMNGVCSGAEQTNTSSTATVAGTSSNTTAIVAAADVAATTNTFTTTTNITTTTTNVITTTNNNNNSGSILPSSNATIISTTTSNTSGGQAEAMAVDLGEESPPKRKRGRPKGSGIKRREEPSVAPLPASPVRKRGWPLGVPRKGYSAAVAAAAAKGKRGRPRKVPEFGFHSIVSDIKTITLPSDLWSAHVSVTAKRSQVCFTRVVQAVSSAVPVECDRSVKFNGSLKHLVRINNREVDLLGAPPSVHSLRDVQTLLEIVDDIGINDPVLDYLHR